MFGQSKKTFLFLTQKLQRKKLGVQPPFFGCHAHFWPKMLKNCFGRKKTFFLYFLLFNPKTRKNKKMGVRPPFFGCHAHFCPKMLKKNFGWKKTFFVTFYFLTQNIQRKTSGRVTTIFGCLAYFWPKMLIFFLVEIFCLLFF